MNELFFDSFFARFAALRPSKPKTPACWEQLRASLRRKEIFFIENSYGTSELVP
jgi:hypothetical protein